MIPRDGQATDYQMSVSMAIREVVRLDGYSTVYQMWADNARLQPLARVGEAVGRIAMGHALYHCVTGKDDDPERRWMVKFGSNRLAWRAFGETPAVALTEAQLMEEEE